MRKSTFAFFIGAGAALLAAPPAGAGETRVLGAGGEV
jgi:hypothetical protein